MFRRRFILVITGLFILLLAAIFILNPPEWIQDWRSNTSLDVAQAAMAHDEPEKAVLAARRALQFNDHNRRAQEILAELAGKSSVASELKWRFCGKTLPIRMRLRRFVWRPFVKAQ